MNRRKFLQQAALFGAGLFLPRNMLRSASQRNLLLHTSQPTLDPTLVPKYQESLVIPPAMPKTGTVTGPHGETIDTYEIQMVQFQQEILPTGFRPKTTVWSYRAGTDAGTQNFPAFTIESRVDQPARIKWVNGLVDANGNYLPHLLPVDPTVHWANPPGPRDMRGMFDTTPGPYTGPVPIVTHIHGAHVGEESDGYPESWFLPNAKNIPSGFFSVGSTYDLYKSMAQNKFGVTWEPGSATFQYPNHQRATTLWFHDHALGITRLNVYAGPAGFYLLRGGPDDLPAGVLPGPAPALGDAPGTKYYEIPIAIQDRSFNDDGQFFYPDSRAYFDQGIPPDQFPDGIKYIPDTDISPIWNPEFFANVMVVNGKSWPKLTVEKRRYRLRLLNGCQARFLILKFAASPEAPRPVDGVLPFWQIGNEGGFLRAPVQQTQLLMAPAERADVIIDFTNVPAGTSLYLINEGPDDPYGGGVVNVDFLPADPRTTGQILRFDVVAADPANPDTSTPPASLTLPNLPHLQEAIRTRQVSLNESVSSMLFDVHGDPYGPIEAELGTVGADGKGVPQSWMDPVTETPTEGDTEIWEIHNFTMDAHPIHVHLVMFEVVNREDMMTHTVTPPEPWEDGRKDTVIAYPGAITRIKAHFDQAGRYVWHCHILEHEDNEMMRPYQVMYRQLFPNFANE